MSKILGRAVALLIVFSMLSAFFTGCGDANTNKGETSRQSSSTQATVQEQNQDVTFETAEDSSDLPTWTGKQLKLTYWSASGTGGNRKVPIAPKDVVTPEITRVTGVTLDHENSFDNGGTDYNQKLALLVAAGNQWPHFIIQSQDPDTLVKEGIVYDLTDLIKAKNMAPNATRKLPLDNPDLWGGFGSDGTKLPPGEYKVYALPLGYSGGNALYPLLSKLYPDELNDEVAKDYFGGPYSITSTQHMYVRDDLLKKLYPNARTTEELQKIYVDRGTYTKEELYDVPLRTKEEVFDFLRRMKKLIEDENINEGKNAPVWTSFARSGSDNWALLTCFWPSLYGYSGDANFSYYTQFSLTDKTVRFAYEDPVFKEMVKDLNQLVKEGIFSKESFTYTQDQFQQKWSNGQFAVNYAWWKPNNAELKQNGKNYQYRPVYHQIKIDQEKWPVFPQILSGGERLMICKESVKEEDLPQILRWYDFMWSDAGGKLLNWGPRSAGLFEEVNGYRKFKDPVMEDAVEFKTNRQIFADYGLFNLVRKSDGNPDETIVSNLLKFNNRGPFEMAYHYTRLKPQVRKPEDYTSRFSIDYTDPYSNLTIAHPPAIWLFASTQCPLMNEAWKKRSLIEDSLMKCYTGLDDDKFEQAFANFQKIAREQVGYTEEASKQATDYYFNEILKNYPNAFK